jgi:uncharacterized protein
MGLGPYWVVTWRSSRATSSGTRRRPTSNLKNHGISFFEATTVFADPLAVYLDDGSGVGTLVAIGSSLRDPVRCVIHVERGDRDRIISARRATAGERDVYEGGDRR